MPANKILFATNNTGKLKEVRKIAAEFGITKVYSPADFNMNLYVIEDGNTFNENAAKKTEAYTTALKDPSVLVIADDSGIEIPALNNEPGVRTRRWVGREMADQEIIDHCLKKMAGLRSGDRQATFKTVLALSRFGHKTEFFKGTLQGEILSQQSRDHFIDGLPFAGLFYLPTIGLLLGDLHGKTLAERNGFMTHREKALHKLYEYITNNGLI